MDDQEDLYAGAPAARGRAGTSGTFWLGQVAGIDVGIHYTWLIAFALITFSLAVGFFPFVSPGLSTGLYWVMGAISAILLFISVLIHEFCHSLVAKARGIPVSNITLFIFGGISNIQEEPQDPGQEFVIAIVGPLSSLVLAGVFWGIYLVVGQVPGLAAVLFYLAIVNLLLGLFNLLPGFPLDGGRVLRSIIWAITGNLYQATNWATGAGQVFAFLLIILGVLEIFAGSFLSGIWIAFIGWFLNGAAESSRRQVAMQQAFRGVRVRDLMTPNPPVVEPSLPVRVMIEEYALRRGARALLVVTDGRLAGIVTLSDLHKLPPERWSDTTVGQIMTPVPLVTVEPNADLQSALRLMGQRDLNQLPVVDHGTLVGLLTRSNVIRYLHFRDELGAPPPTIGARGEGERRRAA